MVPSTPSSVTSMYSVQLMTLTSSAPSPSPAPADAPALAVPPPPPPPLRTLERATAPSTPAAAMPPPMRNLRRSIGSFPTVGRRAARRRGVAGPVVDVIVGVELARHRRLDLVEVGAGGTDDRRAPREHEGSFGRPGQRDQVAGLGQLRGLVGIDRDDDLRDAVEVDDQTDLASPGR